MVLAFLSVRVVGVGRCGKWESRVLGEIPKAPEAPDYVQTEFEHAELPRDVDAVVARYDGYVIAERNADVQS